MNRERLVQQGIIPDDKGIALTEFCIVMPVVLLLFMAVLQFYEISRDAQMVNYGCYVAARSYAVLHDQTKAKEAAVMALAPVSNNLGLSGTPLSGISSILGTLGSAIPGGQGAARLSSGAISAYASLMLGSFSVVSNGISGSKLGQVQVTINYPQFINIAGFKAFWTMFSGSVPFDKHSYLAGNDSLEAAYYYYQNYQWSQSNAKEVAAGLGFAQGVVNVPGTCTTGYEVWGGVKGQDPQTYQDALDKNNQYNTVYQNWWGGSSGSWQPRSAAKP